LAKYKTGKPIMQEMVAVMKALSDQNRCRIMAALQAHTELCACQITELLQVTGANVSRHMGILVRAGLVESRKSGRWTYFRMDPRPPAGVAPILNWLRVGVEQSARGEHDRRALHQILSMNKEDLCRRQRGEACCPLPGRAASDTTLQTKEHRP
jgi:ArsR family transcriptional regulator, arsenate/arsenite/antimonite-responsive transcriptional repressor